MSHKIRRSMCACRAPCEQAHVDLGFHWLLVDINTRRKQSPMSLLVLTRCTLSVQTCPTERSSFVGQRFLSGTFARSMWVQFKELCHSLSNSSAPTAKRSACARVYSSRRYVLEHAQRLERREGAVSAKIALLALFLLNGSSLHLRSRLAKIAVAGCFFRSKLALSTPWRSECRLMLQ